MNLLLIDGHSLAYRAFYALDADSFKTSFGQNTNAVVGFLNMFLSLNKTYAPSYAAVAFDLSRKSFRTESYPGYKATRSAAPEEFKGQTQILQQILNAMNIACFTYENYEADDILASLSYKAYPSVTKTFIVSGDRDIFQLINDKTSIICPKQGVKKSILYNSAAVMEKYGVPSDKYRLLAALVGESSDNLIGVKKVGPKTAANLINLYGSIDNIYNNLDKLLPSLAKNLKEGKNNVYLNLKLNKLKTDLPLIQSIDELKTCPCDSQKLIEILDKYEINNLKSKLLNLYQQFF